MRAGWYRKNLSGEAEYMSFVPSNLPPEPDIAMGSELVLSKSGVIPLALAMGI